MDILGSLMDFAPEYIVLELAVVTILVNTVHWMRLRRVYACKFFILHTNPAGKLYWPYTMGLIAMVLLTLLGVPGLISPRLSVTVANAWLIAMLVASIRLRHLGKPAPDEA